LNFICSPWMSGSSFSDSSERILLRFSENDPFNRGDRGDKRELCCF